MDRNRGGTENPQESDSDASTTSVKKTKKDWNKKARDDYAAKPEDEKQAYRMKKMLQQRERRACKTEAEKQAYRERIEQEKIAKKAITRERKRARDRAAWNGISQEKKDERNAQRNEKYRINQPYQKKRSKMSIEELENYREKVRDQYWNKTEEQREEIRRVARERLREKLAKETDEDRAERKRKHNEYIESLTPDQRINHAINKKLTDKRRYDRMTPVEKQEFLGILKEKYRLKMDSMSPDERQEHWRVIRETKAQRRLLNNGLRMAKVKTMNPTQKLIWEYECRQLGSTRIQPESDEKRKEIEKITRQGQLSSDWRAERRGVVTGTKMYRIIANQRADLAVLAERMMRVGENPLKTIPMQLGILYEPRAVDSYLLRTGRIRDEFDYPVGLTKHPEYGFIGCTPDLLSKDKKTVIEFKYSFKPISQGKEFLKDVTNEKNKVAAGSYIHDATRKNRKYALRTRSYQYNQLITQMICTGAEKGYLVVYNDSDKDPSKWEMWSQEILKSEALRAWKKMLPKVKAFYNKYFLPKNLHMPIGSDEDDDCNDDEYVAIADSDDDEDEDDDDEDHDDVEDADGDEFDDIIFYDEDDDDTDDDEDDKKDDDDEDDKKDDDDEDKDDNDDNDHDQGTGQHSRFRDYDDNEDNNGDQGSKDNGGNDQGGLRRSSRIRRMLTAVRTRVVNAFQQFKRAREIRQAKRKQEREEVDMAIANAQREIQLNRKYACAAETFDSDAFWKQKKTDDDHMKKSNKNKMVEWDKMCQKTSDHNGYWKTNCATGYWTTDTSISREIARNSPSSADRVEHDIRRGGWKGSLGEGAGYGYASIETSTRLAGFRIRSVEQSRGTTNTSCEGSKCIGVEPRFITRIGNWSISGDARYGCASTGTSIGQFERRISGETEHRYASTGTPSRRIHGDERFTATNAPGFKANEPNSVRTGYSEKDRSHVVILGGHEENTKAGFNEGRTHRDLIGAYCKWKAAPDRPERPKRPVGR